jgi:hypothetical protein
VALFACLAQLSDERILVYAKCQVRSAIRCSCKHFATFSDILALVWWHLHGNFAVPVDDLQIGVDISKSRLLPL